MSDQVTERDHELLAMQTVMEQFPIKYPNGKEWEEFDGNCASCDGIIARSHVRGIVTNPMPGISVVEAVGYCKPCNFLTRYNYHLRDNMTMSGRNPSGWKTWQLKPSIWEKIKKFLFN